MAKKEDGFRLPTEIMSTFEPATLPPHHLKLKYDYLHSHTTKESGPSGDVHDEIHLQIKQTDTKKSLDCRIFGGKHNGRRHHNPAIQMLLLDSMSLHARLQ